MKTPNRHPETIRWPWRLVAAVGWFFLTPAPCRAQESERDSAAASLPEIVITALRTPSAAAQVPYAVTVVGPSEIGTGRRGFSLDELLFAVPGVQIENRYNFALGERLSIRGFGARAQFGVRGVKVLLDGIPATFPDGQSALGHIDMEAVGRVEVIRGPASALYGNAAGGVVHFQSPDPPSSPLVQTLAVTAGSNGLRRFRSATSGTLGSTTYAFDVSRLAYAGYRAFSEAENLYLGGRIGRRYRSGGWQLTGRYAGYEAENPGSLSDSLLRADRSQAYLFNRVQQTGETGRQGQAGLRWTRTVGAGELVASGYGLLRRIDNPIPSAYIDLYRKAAGVRMEYRGGFGAGAAFARWTLGAEMDAQHDDRQNFGNEQGRRGALRLDQIEQVVNGGVFGQVSAGITERLSALGGLRFDAFTFEAEDRLVDEGNPDHSGRRTMTALSPSAGVVFLPSPGMHVYANAATSFETPTTTELVNRPDGTGGFNPDLDPQRTLSFESGLRTRAGRTGRVHVAVYRAVVRKALVPFESAEAPGRTFFRNAGSAVHRGVEAGADWAPASGFRMRAGYTLTDARFRKYETGGRVYDGNRIPGIALHRIEAGMDIRRKRGWFASVEGRYAGEMFVNDANRASSPAYTLVGIRLGFEAVQLGPMQAAFFGGADNVFDQGYNTSVVVNAFGGRYYEPGPGRTFHAGMRVDIGRGEGN